MKRQHIPLKATNEAELKAEVVALSKQHPTKAVTVLVTFGVARAYLHTSVSRIPVDGPDTRQMLTHFNGHIAFVAGKLVKPTKGWNKKQDLYNARTHQE